MTDDSIDPQSQLLSVIVGIWSELKTVNAFTSCSLAIPQCLFESLDQSWFLALIIPVMVEDSMGRWMDE